MHVLARIKVIDARVLAAFVLLLSSSASWGENYVPLNLSCALISEDFPGIDESVFMDDLVLKGGRETASGKIKVFATQEYEFWLMSDVLVKLPDASRYSINSFRVLVKDTQKGQSFYARSVQSSATQMRKASVGIATFDSDYYLSDQELIFECRDG